MTEAQLLAELEDLLRSMPPREKLNHEDDVNMIWFGRARAIVSGWNKLEGVAFSQAVDRFFGPRTLSFTNEFATMMTMLQEARFDLRMRIGMRAAVSVGPGQPFDFFDAVRKVIELAQSDLFVIDPYIKPDFVSRYLPHVRSGVTIRLLTRQYIAKLIPSVEQFARQHGCSIEVRRSVSHDRFLFIDGRECYHSSATFQDGGVQNASMLAPVTDTFADTQRICESEWRSAVIERAP